MITSEKNPYREERNRIRQIFQLLKDVKLPEPYKFVNDCVQIRRITWRGLNDVKIADIYMKKGALRVVFVDEEELDRLRKYFVESETKFELSVERDY